MNNMICNCDLFDDLINCRGWIIIKGNVDSCLFEVFPGIIIRYEGLASVTNRGINPEIEGEIIEISYCYDGKIECLFEGGGCVYMGSGDLYA